MIIAAQHNTPLEDLATANNYPRPIIAGGTGANNSALAATNLSVLSYLAQSLTAAEKNQILLNISQPFGTIASAATTDLGSITSQNIIVTGTTTITSFGSGAVGIMRTVRFSSPLTLTHNATSLILPNGGSNISVLGGDALYAVSLGGGNWVVTNYQPVTPIAVNLQASVNLSSTAVTLSNTIPTWATRITVMLGSVSLSGSAAVLIQLGNGSVETSGYQANSASIPDSISPSTLNSAVGFPVFIAGAAQSFSGAFTFTKMIDSSNTWTCTGTFTRHDGAILIVSAGRKSFSGAPTVVRITTTNGTDTFDAGNAAVSWE